MVHNAKLIWMTPLLLTKQGKLKKLGKDRRKVWMRQLQNHRKCAFSRNYWFGGPEVHEPQLRGSSTFAHQNRSEWKYHIVTMKPVRTPVCPVTSFVHLGKPCLIMRKISLLMAFLMGESSDFLQSYSINQDLKSSEEALDAEIGQKPQKEAEKVFGGNLSTIRSRKRQQWKKIPASQPLPKAINDVLFYRMCEQNSPTGIIPC